MAPIRVADVTDPGHPDAHAFHRVVEGIYANQPPGTAPSTPAIERNIARPEFAARQRLLVAFEGERPVARVAARVAPQLRDTDGTPCGLLSFFEAHDHRAATVALLDAGTAWLREQGVRTVYGPMDGDTWHRYRVNVGPFHRPPFPLEPWNPPYYESLWRAAGFDAVESYSSKWIEQVESLLPGLEPGVQRSQSRGVRIRGLRRDRLEEELAIVHALSSRIFEDAFLYTPIPRGDFLAMYAPLGGALDPSLVIFAESPEGEPVGFVFAYADPAVPAVHYKTIGVLADWRRSAVAAALSHHVYTNALAMGRPQGNHALMRDDNRSQALDQGEGEVFRRYRLFGKAW